MRLSRLLRFVPISQVVAFSCLISGIGYQVFLPEQFDDGVIACFRPVTTPVDKRVNVCYEEVQESEVTEVQEPAVPRVRVCYGPTKYKFPERGSVDDYCRLFCHEGPDGSRDSGIYHTVKRPVVYASKDIEEDETITSKALTVTRVCQCKVKNLSVIHSTDSIVGKRALLKIHQGAPLCGSDVY